MEPKLNPDGTPVVEPAKAPETPPAVDVAALQAELAKTQQQLQQVMVTITANQPAPAREPEPQAPQVQVTPEFQAQSEAFYQKHLQPFLQQMDQRFAQLAGWQSGQQLHQHASALELPDELRTEAQNLMGAYANANRPISYQTAVRQILGEREEKRLLQEAANRRSQSKFNTSIMPTFSGSGGLPNLQPLTGTKPKDNDINGWAALANQNDLPL